MPTTEITLLQFITCNQIPNYKLISLNLSLGTEIVACFTYISIGSRDLSSIYKYRMELLQTPQTSVKLLNF